MHKKNNQKKITGKKTLELKGHNTRKQFRISSCQKELEAEDAAEVLVLR